MASVLSSEFLKFNKQVAQLKQLLNDTKRCFQDINTAGKFETGPPVTAELTGSEEREIEAVTDQPPCIVVFGQTLYAKAAVANELFNKMVLPQLDLAEQKGERLRWRMVRFKYGERNSVSLALAGSYELVDSSLAANTGPWQTVPCADLEIRRQRQAGGGHKTGAGGSNSNSLQQTTPAGSSSRSTGSPRHVHQNERIEQGETNGHDLIDDEAYDDECDDNEDCADHDERARGLACLEVRLPHALLREGGQVVVGPSNCRDSIEKVYEASVEGVTPILVYAFSREVLSEKDLDELRDLKDVAPDQPVLFIKVPPPVPPLDMPPVLITDSSAPMRTLQSALERHGLVDSTGSSTSTASNVSADSAVACGAGGGGGDGGGGGSPTALTVFQQLLDIGYLNLLSTTTGGADAKVYRVDSDLVEHFENLSGGSMAAFARRVLRSVLVRATNLLNVVHARCLQNFIETAFDMQRDMLITPRRLEYARQKETELYAMLMEMALRKQDEIKRIIAETIADMRDDLLAKAADFEFKGVHIDDDREEEGGQVLSPRDLKSCTAQIQDLVLSTLNTAVAGKLLGSVDILKDSYTGVLTRCLHSLEQSDRENANCVRTTMALKDILNAAYRVEITVRAGSSIIKVLLEKMKQLMASMLWTPPPQVNREWKRKVADDMLSSLSESRLAKSLCTQIKDRLRHSHDHFSTALRQLEVRHSGRLERTEEHRLRVRKVHAPKVARLALESISLRDFVLYGMPQMAREVGRGQYGVVYSCDTWGGYSPCAIKSVVPPDDKHWNDLALEFYYTKNVPEHDRLVPLRGSVIDYSYGGGCSPAVLLVMDRLQRDLYTAIKFNLDWLSRLQVAIDVVEGIRFLHSQGLVHRDIKLKNVLLDRKNRGKITDLGFCKPEAMMSGSIVGTPIHMAPELFSGRYDNSVDVYAFGILFWYVCAGHVKLPFNFEQCTSKDMLWSSVKRGTRPERLPQFDQECWDLMTACWHSKPDKRPLLGLVEPRLCAIREQHRLSSPPGPTPSSGSGSKKGRTRERAMRSPDMDSPTGAPDGALKITAGRVW